METFSSEEFLELSRELEKHHSVFYRLWNVGRPIFSNDVERAAAKFDKVGDNVIFVLNYDWWITLSKTEKYFVICHECLHIILNHYVRIKNADDKIIANKALDLIVNHLLIDKFGFVRAEVDKENKYCWLDQFFDDTVESGKSFEYYYNLMVQQSDQLKDKIQQLAKLVDSHEDMEDFGSILEQLNEEMPDFEKDSLKEMIQKHFSKDDNDKNGQQAGKSAGNVWVFANIGNVKKKKKWETVIKKWAQKQIKEDSVEEQWARTNRRLTFFDGDLILPSEAEEDGMDLQRIQVWFFQDTSGSCSGFIDRFFKAAASLPEDRFDVKMHCFDTRVYETTLASKKLFGFGGTSFSCIEEYIQSHIKKNNLPYPTVFCITDGFGTNVNPAFPKKWHWFLSHNYTAYIPKESRVYMLKDFE